MAKVGKATRVRACGCCVLPKRRKTSKVRTYICPTHSSWGKS